MRNQRGLSMWEILVLCIVIVMLAIGGLKVTPAYIEYYKIKKAVTGVAQSGEARGTVGDIRKAFDRYAVIDDIDAVRGQDLDISKDGNEVVISFSYSRKVPLFGPVSLWFDFTGSSSNN